MERPVQNLTIREISNAASIAESALVIRNSFRTVARDFNLTKENCPTHSSFTTAAALHVSKGKMEFFGGFLGGEQIGFVALEKAGEKLYYMERLAMPRYRHRGYGTSLVEFIANRVWAAGGGKISIGIIDESLVLKNWYKRLGFNETSTRKFGHLPFTVCFMEKDIGPGLDS